MDAIILRTFNKYNFYLLFSEQSNENSWNSFEANDADDAIHKISKIWELEFKPYGIEAQRNEENGKNGVKAKKLKSLLTNAKKHLRTKSLASKEAGQTFVKLLKSAESASKAEVLAALKEKSNSDILPQLLDAFGSCSNPEVHEAVFETVGNPAKAGRMELLERYMFAMAHSTSDNNDVLLEKYFKIAQNGKIPHDKLKQTLILTLADLSRKSKKSELTNKVLKWLVNSMLTCKEDECYQNYLRALKSMKSEAAIPILLKIVEAKDTHYKSARLSLEALSKFESEVLRIKIKNLDQHLLTLLKNPETEMSLKSLAFEMLLKNSPKQENIKEVLKTLKFEKNRELIAILLQKWTDMADDPYIKSLLKISVKNGWLDWNIMSHGGLSTSFSRILSQNLAGNASFTFDLEVSGLLMKRSNFELNFVQESGSKTNMIEVCNMFKHFLTPSYGEGEVLGINLLLL